MAFDLPGGDPALKTAVERAFRSVMSFPFRLWRVATADLPTATTDNEGGLLYDSTASILKWSDGSNWIAPSLSGHTHTEADITLSATDRLVGRDTAGAGAAEELTVDGGIEFTGSGGIQTSAFTGDATKAAGGTALTLATVNSNVGTFGSATQALQVTVNAKGLVTAVANVTITPAWGSITDTPTTLAGYGITDAEATITAGTTAQYWRGDKSWQTLDKAAVGLANVDNTSDANKPVSTATQTALNAKLDDSQATAAGLSMLGAADVPAQRTLLRSGAMVERTAALTGQDWTGGGVISWDAEIRDDGGWWVAGSPTIFTVPSGVTHVRVGAVIALANVTASVQVAVTVLKGGSATWDGRPAQSNSVPLTNPRINLSSGPIPVSAGDTFSVQVTVQTDTSVDLTLNSSHFWIEAC